MKSIDIAYRKFCEQRFSLPTREQVAAVESRIGTSLPEDYWNYLLDFNGGLFSEPDIVPATEECPVDCLTFMKGIGATEPVAELASDADLCLFSDNYPAQIVLVGETMMGNLILLVTREEDFGQIILKTFTEYHFLANSIDDFFSLLRDP